MVLMTYLGNYRYIAMPHYCLVSIALPPTVQNHLLTHVEKILRNWLYNQSDDNEPALNIDNTATPQIALIDNTLKSDTMTDSVLFDSSIID